MGPHEEQAPPLTRDHPAGRRQHGPFKTAQVERAALATEKPDLVAKVGVLKLQGLPGGTAAEPAQGSVHHEVEEQKHGRILEDAAQVRTSDIRAPHLGEPMTARSSKRPGLASELASSSVPVNEEGPENVTISSSSRPCRRSSPDTTPAA